MLAVRLHGNSDLRVDQVPEPDAVGPGQVRVEPQWCGICGTDLHEYAHGPLYTPGREPAAGDRPRVLRGDRRDRRGGHRLPARRPRRRAPARLLRQLFLLPPRPAGAVLEPEADRGDLALGRPGRPGHRPRVTGGRAAGRGLVRAGRGAGAAGDGGARGRALGPAAGRQRPGHWRRPDRPAGRAGRRRGRGRLDLPVRAAGRPAADGRAQRRDGLRPGVGRRRRGGDRADRRSWRRLCHRMLGRPGRPGRLRRLGPPGGDRGRHRDPPGRPAGAAGGLGLARPDRRRGVVVQDLGHPADPGPDRGRDAPRGAGGHQPDRDARCRAQGHPAARRPGRRPGEDPRLGGG